MPFSWQNREKRQGLYRHEILMKEKALSPVRHNFSPREHSWLRLKLVKINFGKDLEFWGIVALV
jgi:hypothetical protein